MPEKWEDTRKDKGTYFMDVDDNQQFVKVQVIEPGKDFAEYMEKVVAKYKGRGDYSIQVAVFSDSPSVILEYEQLHKLGFFFTGLKPLCGPREQFYMQWIDDWNLCMEDYVLTDSFSELREDIEEFYKGRENC